MKYVTNGETLRDHLGGASWPLERILKVLPQVSEALQAAHEAGVVHRDVKPSNILVTPELHCLVFDFGIAKPLRRGNPSTGKGLIVGTPEYMSPEQCKGEPVDHRTDIYSLGILSYEMLTGRVPFTAETAVGILMKHLTEPLPFPDEPHGGSLSPSVFGVLERALARDPEERYPTARGFGRAFMLAAAESPTVTIKSTALGRAMSDWKRRTARLRIRRRAALMAGAVLVLATVGSVLFGQLLGLPEGLPRPHSPDNGSVASSVPFPERSRTEGRQPSVDVSPGVLPPATATSTPALGLPVESNAGGGTAASDALSTESPASPTTVNERPPLRRWQGFLTDENCREQGGLQGALHLRCAQRCIREGAQPMLYSKGKLYKIEGLELIELKRGKPLDFKGRLDPKTNTITVAYN
jgi:serine/threonine protein kinase